MDAKSGLPVFDAVKYRKHARQIRVNGEIRTEKRPIQQSAQAVDSSGNVVWLPLYTGPAQHAENDPYRLTTQYEKRRAGFVWLERCPQGDGYETQRHLPDSVRGRPLCREGHKGGPVSKDNPCECVLAVIRERQAANARKMGELEMAGRTAEQRQQEMQAATLEETRKQNAMLAQLAAQGRGGNRGGEQK